MQGLRSLPVRFLIVGLASAGLLTGLGWWLHGVKEANRVPSQSYSLQTGQLNGWTSVGGKWNVVNGAIRNDSYERGAKLLTGSSAWGNYTLTSDVAFEDDNADMGLVVRVSHAEEGTDTYDGYYIGLRTLDSTMVIGRAAFGWTEAPPVHIPGGIRSGVWYRLRVTAYGCNIAASVQNLTTLQSAWIAFTQTDCLKTGQIGIRSLNAGGMWRNISVAPAQRNDYEQLRSHVASVERLEVMPGPPWWTPWHVSMLFVGTLAFALLAQLLYFRIQQWKAYAITRERERLAHDIHDTMAQSFAGIGYQIQGIRSTLLRADHLDLSHVAEQLQVAYQLVRTCHEEASRTIAMLGSGPSPAPQHLLVSLAELAHKLTDDRVKVFTELKGNPPPLSFQVADALVHIGREAIVNAVSHSNPTVLVIRLIYRHNKVVLLVEDNGGGFEYNAETAGFGILGMQQAARNVNGTLNIQSTPGQGTRVRVTVQMRNISLLKRIFTRNEEQPGSASSTPSRF